MVNPFRGPKVACEKEPASRRECVKGDSFSAAAHQKSASAASTLDARPSEATFPSQDTVGLRKGSEDPGGFGARHGQRAQFRSEAPAHVPGNSN